MWIDKIKNIFSPRRDEKLKQLIRQLLIHIIFLNEIMRANGTFSREMFSTFNLECGLGDIKYKWRIGIHECIVYVYARASNL